VSEPVRTLFLGSGEVALPALERLLDGDLARIEAVVTAPPRPAGRKRILTPTPVARLAQERGLTVLTPPRLRDEAVVTELAARTPELIVLADYGRLVPAALLELPPHGALNIHPSLLPRHRGAAPVVGAILAGDTATGVTIMRMDAGLDTGPIVAQRELALDGTEVAPELEARLAQLGADLLIDVLPDWLAGRVEARPQPPEGATLTRPLRRDDGRLDPERSARELERQVRAFQPWPGSFLEIEGERVIVWRAAVAAVPGAARGEILPVGDTLGLGSAEAVLRLDEVQPSGGTRMSGAAYRRGRWR
jgi:methionyl-tRNA formyltransferase